MFELLTSRDNPLLSIDICGDCEAPPRCFTHEHTHLLRRVVSHVCLRLYPIEFNSPTCCPSCLDSWSRIPDPHLTTLNARHLCANPIPSGVALVEGYEYQERQKTHHEAAGITDQKHGSAAILFRSRETLQHVLRRPLCFPLWKLLEQLLYHGRYNISWREGIDPNLVFAPFGRQIPPKLYHTGFRGIVGGANKALQ
jgi:hypothetical protein